MYDYEGKRIKFSITGASHTDFVGFRAVGLPEGFIPDVSKVQIMMDRRKPGGLNVSQRKEDDVPEFSWENGEFVCKIANNDVKRAHYDELRDTPRPGTADYTARIKYGEDFDMSGSGPFSGRMTAPMVALGASVMQLPEMENISIRTRIIKISGGNSCGECDKIIENIVKVGDSAGGIVECVVTGLPAGFGGPMFEGLEGKLAAAVFGIPGVKGIEFGSGFAGALTNGSENNDEMYYDNEGTVKFSTNNCGGILGGISTGEEIVFRVAVKPTPSIAKKQKTINMKLKTNVEIEIHGRHDPCIALRVGPVIEALTGVVIYDLC